MTSGLNIGIISKGRKEVYVNTFNSDKGEYFITLPFTPTILVFHNDGTHGTYDKEVFYDSTREDGNYYNTGNNQWTNFVGYGDVSSFDINGNVLHFTIPSEDIGYPCIIMGA